MIKTVLLFALLVGAAIADLKHFPDRDAFLLAQRENQSLLEPPKEVYEKIVKELTQIHKDFPQLAHIHVVRDFTKLICNGIDLDKVNSSTYGPILVEDIGHKELLISFSRPYDLWQLSQILVANYTKSVQERGCHSVRNIGLNHFVRRSVGTPIIPRKYPVYTFQEGSGNCFEGCDKMHFWTLDNKSGKFAITADWVEEKNKTITTHSLEVTTVKA